MSAVCICDVCNGRIGAERQEARFIVDLGVMRGRAWVEIKPMNGSLDICMECATEAFLKHIKPQEQAA